MKYFTIQELTKSSTATRKGIDNTPSQEVVSNLTALVDRVLDPVREKYGKPIRVTSGYRCPKLNKAVGGSSTSQHVKGQAADITSISDSFVDNKILFTVIKNSGLVFDQLIYEYGNSTGPDWVHVSYNPSGTNRKQILKAVKSSGKTVYQVYKG